MNLFRSELRRPGASSSRFRKPSDRRVGAIRPSLEALEARLVLNASGLDASFGAKGVVLSPATDTTQQLSIPSTVNALATQTDGKVVEIETRSSQVGSTSPYSTLVARRFNADGSVDTTFGTDGAAIILAPTADSITQVHDLTISADGSIVLDVNVTHQAAQYTYTYNSIVLRVTPGGQLDSGFGSDGAVILATVASGSAGVTVQSDNKIVVATVNSDGSSSNPRYSVALTRLTTAGTLDTSFHSTGQLTFNLANDQNQNTYYGNTNDQLTIADLGVTSTGLIYVGTNLNSYYYGNSPGADLTRVTSAGVVDTSYGTNGTTTSATIQTLQSLVVQTDGKLLLGGQFYGAYNTPRAYQYVGVLSRLNTDGTVDPTFQGFNGSETTGVTPRFSGVTALAIAANGKILFEGGAGIGQLLANGTVDSSFGVAGVIPLNLSQALSFQTPYRGYTSTTSLAVTATGEVLVGGQVQPNIGYVAEFQPAAIRSVANDYDGDGKSDIAIQLSNLGIFAYRPSSGLADQLQGFGMQGVGSTLSAPGDYQGNGITNVAAYLPSAGQFASRASVNPSPSNYYYGSDTLTYFGTYGTGNSIPAAGDYDGDGLTDDAVYLPKTGSFLIRSSAYTGGTSPYYYYGTNSDTTTPFGQTGAGNSIPAPGDYDGDGKTDLAVYLPKLGALAYRPSSGGADQIITFGQVGSGASIPVPGDYDGDGKTDLAVYIPSLAQLIYRPSSGAADVVTTFGQTGAGTSIPAPGDYDGDGKTDIAVYIPSLAQFIYRPSTGGADVVNVFGKPGAGQSVPVASISYAQQTPTAGTNARGTGAAAPSAVVYIPLTDDMTNPTPTAKKKTTGTV